MTNLESILRTHGLEELIPMFESQGIDDSALAGLTDSDLALIGVSKLGDRKKLLYAFSGKTIERETRNLAASPKKKTFWYNMGWNSLTVILAAFVAYLIIMAYRLTGQTETTGGTGRMTALFGFASYQSILDTYSEKIRAATPKLIEEYKTEASKNTDGIEGLAKISNDKISKLAKISNEGVGEMAKIMYKTGSGKFSEYQDWGAKLMEVYMSEGAKITDVYMKSAR